MSDSPKDRKPVLLSIVLNQAIPLEKDFDTKFWAYQSYLKEAKAFWPEGSDEPVYVLEEKSHRVTGDWNISQEVYIGQRVYGAQGKAKGEEKIDPTIIRDQKRFQILLTEKEKQELVEGINLWYTGLTDELQELKRKKGAIKANHTRALRNVKKKHTNAERAVDNYAGDNNEEVGELNRLVRNEKEKMVKLISEAQKELKEIDKEMAEIRTRLGRGLGKPRLRLKKHTL